MLRQTHVAVGMCVAALAASPLTMQPGQLLVLLVVASISSVLPDLDLRIKHRMLLHSLPSLAVATLILTVVWALLSLPYPSLAILGFAAGYASHILLDMLTVRGVALLYPFTRRRYRILRLSSSSPAANTLLTVSSTVILLLIILYKLAATGTTVILPLPAWR